MPHTIRLSIVVPTTRPRFIEEALDALVVQTCSQFEVVVVENGERTGDLEELVRSFGSRLTISYVYTPKEGINHARNIGVKASSANLIALTDDDCVPAPDWAERVLEVHEEFPNAGIVGGRVKLKFLAVKPRWLVGEFRVNLSEVHLTDNVAEIQPNQYVVGANLSFKRSIFSAVGGFREDLGLIGRSAPQLVHDEKLFVRNARNLGQPGVVYTPHAIIEHQIPAGRLQIEYHEHRRYGLGVSDIDLKYAATANIEPSSVLRSFFRAVDNQRSVVEKARLEYGSMDNEVFCEYQSNLMRARIAYMSGLQDRVLDRFRPGTIHVTLANPELRYYQRGKMAVQRCYKSGMSKECILDHIVKLFVRERKSYLDAGIESRIHVIHYRIAFWKGLRDEMAAAGRSGQHKLVQK